MALRSLLFVPGSRPDRFAKAAGAGADLVCIDLEDAVLPENKLEARHAVTAWIAEQPRKQEICVRINPSQGELGRADLDALGAVAELSWVMLPKVASAQEVQRVAELLPQVALIALIESPAGVLAAAEIAGAHTALRALMFGAADFSAEMGCEMRWEPLLAARGQLALAAGAAGCDLIDVPFLDVADKEGLESETRAVQAMGFTAKAAIHPEQVATINRVFSPNPEQLAWAQAVVDAVGGDENAAAVVDGKFVDRPVILRAQHILAQRQDD